MEPKYTAADIKVLEPRAVILARPARYFGALERWEWPLAMLAMALDVPGEHREGLTVGDRRVAIRPDGSFEVATDVDGFEWVRSDARRKASDNLRVLSWWRVLLENSSFGERDMREEAVTRDGMDLVRSTGTFLIAASPDPTVCDEPGRWWQDWRERLEAVARQVGVRRDGPIDVRVTDVSGTAIVRIAPVPAATGMRSHP